MKRRNRSENNHLPDGRRKLKMSPRCGVEDGYYSTSGLSCVGHDNTFSSRTPEQYHSAVVHWRPGAIAVVVMCLAYVWPWGHQSLKDKTGKNDTVTLL